MNRTSPEERKAVVGALVEGASINSTVRMTGTAKTTILRLLQSLGCACSKYLHDHVRVLKPARVQCDEVWSFVHCKAKHVAKAKAAPLGAGDAWTWTAIDPDTKLIITFHVGLRTPDDARDFMLDLAGRIGNLTQLTTDGLTSYPQAVYEAFGTGVDYAQLIKIYREDRTAEATYSPAKCIGAKKQHVIGAPDPAHISTSIVERSNLTIRMGMRRFTRLTNGHSKKIENHGHAFAMFLMHYNFCRVHSTIGTTPAVKAGLTDHVWTLDELIGLEN